MPSWTIPVTESGNLVKDGYRPADGDRLVDVIPAEVTPDMVIAAAESLRMQGFGYDPRSSDPVERTSAYAVAEKVLRDALASPRQDADRKDVDHG